jgi:hypothetical protein
MTQPGYSYLLSARLEPVCPRDNKLMRYEASGLPSGSDERPSYRCGYQGCSVRYDLINGYFALIGMPGRIKPAEEPGINTLKCEKHGVWLYRRRDQAKQWSDEWCCGVAGCKFCILADTNSCLVKTWRS